MILSEFIKEKTPFAGWNTDNSEQFTSIFGETTGEMLDRYTSLKYGFRECITDTAEDLLEYFKAIVSMNAGNWKKQIDLIATEYTGGGYSLTRTESRTTEGTRNATATDANKAFNDNEFTDDTQRTDSQTDSNTQDITISEKMDKKEPQAIKEYYLLMRENAQNNIISTLVRDLTISIN